MNLGIGLSLTNFLRVPTVPLEDLDAAIAALFGSGEVGAWYDPSDSSTVWQDAAGTTPATVGDPVGRIDDKSGNGNHATQSTSAARPVLQIANGTPSNFGPELVTLSTPSSYTNHTGYIVLGTSKLAGKWYRYQFTLSSVSSGGISIHPERAGLYDSADGSYTHVVLSTSTTLRFYANNFTGTLETASVQEVTAWTGGQYYLDFDGVDDSMSTAAVDFTSTDAISTFVGVTGDSPRTNNSRIFIVSSDLTWSATDGGCSIVSGDGSTDSVRALLYGTSINQTTRVSQSFPYTKVFAALFNAGAASAADEISFRADGAVIDTGSATDSGITSFGLQQIYLSKSTTSSSGYFGGRIYGLVIRGATSDSAEVSDAETYLAAKSGVTL